MPHTICPDIAMTFELLMTVRKSDSNKRLKCNKTIMANPVKVRIV